MENRTLRGRGDGQPRRGTAEGQRDLLAEYGVSQAALGAPVKTDMTTVKLGVNSWGEPVFWDKNAYEADAVITISRVKAHTDFRSRYESGIVKMLGIGLGKRDGAAQHHRWGLRGLAEMLPETVKVILEKTKFLAGLAILENANEQTAAIHAIDRENLFAEEPALLEQAKSIMGRIPFRELDLLVIGEIGKNYSGAGIDPNVVGRLLIEGEPETYDPKIIRICALDLSPESHGNGTGVGIADLNRQAAGGHRSGPVSNEQPDRVFPVALQAADRVCHRSRMHRIGHCHLLATGPLETENGHHRQYAGSGRSMGLAGSGGAGEGESRPCITGRADRAAV